jgi:hypothetical protein
MTYTFEESGHVIGIPDRYMTDEVARMLDELGPRATVALIEGQASR